MAPCPSSFAKAPTIRPSFVAAWRPALRSIASTWWSRGSTRSSYVMPATGRRVTPARPPESRGTWEVSDDGQRVGGDPPRVSAARPVEVVHLLHDRGAAPNGRGHDPACVL